MLVRFFRMDTNVIGWIGGEMKSRKGKYLLALALAVVSLGIFVGGFFRESAAQPTAVPLWVAAMRSKPNSVAWKRKEIPLNTINSRFRLNLPIFSPDNDWIVGIKPVKAGEIERMYVGLVTWDDVTNQNGKANGKEPKRISRIENYPEESSSVGDGQASFGNILDDNQTLVIYLEVRPLTEIDVAQNGNEVILKASEGASILFNGKKRSAPLEGPASFLNEVHRGKLRKAAGKPVSN